MYQNAYEQQDAIEKAFAEMEEQGLLPTQQSDDEDEDE